MEKEARTRGLQIHHPHRQSQERRESDLNRSIQLVRNSGFSQDEKDLRIKKLRSAYGIPSENEGGGNNVTLTAIAEAPNASRKSRLQGTRTIFRRH